MNDDDAREYARELFGADRPPADIVPPSGLTLQTLRLLSDMADTWAEVFIPGEPVEDADGNLIAMAPGRTEVVHRGGAVISQGQLQALGLSAEDIERDYPGISVAPPITRRSTEQ